MYDIQIQRVDDSVYFVFEVIHRMYTIRTNLFSNIRRRQEQSSSELTQTAATLDLRSRQFYKRAILRTSYIDCTVTYLRLLYSNIVVFVLMPTQLFCAFVMGYFFPGIRLRILYKRDYFNSNRSNFFEPCNKQDNCMYSVKEAFRSFASTLLNIHLIFQCGSASSEFENNEKNIKVQ